MILESSNSITLSCCNIYCGSIRLFISSVLIFIYLYCTYTYLVPAYNAYLLGHFFYPKALSVSLQLFFYFFPIVIVILPRNLVEAISFLDLYLSVALFFFLFCRFFFFVLSLSLPLFDFLSIQIIFIILCHVHVFIAFLCVSLPYYNNTFQTKAFTSNFLPSSN